MPGPGRSLEQPTSTAPEEVNTISLINPKPETAEQLAAEHARARQEYETRRQSVLSRANTRRSELLDLAEEARKEAAQHAKVVQQVTDA